MEKRKKRIIIILAKRYPIVCGRKNEPTDFAEKIKDGRKKHIIKGNYYLWKHNAELLAKGGYYLSVRQWSERPFRSPQEEVMRIDKPIDVRPIKLTYLAEYDTLTAMLPLQGKFIDPGTLAKNCGMDNEQNLKEWFFSRQINGKLDGVFEGAIIHFGDFQY